MVQLHQGLGARRAQALVDNSFDEEVSCDPI
jgi:hypothetical protein